MRKLILIAHVSLDGFVAGPNGELSGFEPGEENLKFVAGLTKGADAALSGRTTYELLNANWPKKWKEPNATEGEIAYSKWFSKAHQFVVSTTLSDNHEPGRTIIRRNVAEEIAEIKKKRGENILIFGSPGLSRFLIPLGLIDSYWIFVNPVIFGLGLPLFPKVLNHIKLKPQSATSFPNGELALNYDPNQ